MSGLATDEVLAEHLRPPDRFRHSGAEWVAVRVAVTADGPVTVTAKPIRDGMVGTQAQELELVAGTIIRLRR